MSDRSPNLDPLRGRSERETVPAALVSTEWRHGVRSHILVTLGGLLVSFVAHYMILEYRVGAIEERNEKVDRLLSDLPALIERVGTNRVEIDRLRNGHNRIPPDAARTN